MPNTKVILSGCGIAGPVLAIFLKLKGYEPVIYERGSKGSSGGTSMMLQPNGLRVLKLIPGLTEKIVGHHISQIKQLSVVPGDEGVIGVVDMPVEEMVERHGFVMTGVKRSQFHQTLIDAAVEHGVEIIYNHQLASIEQKDTEVHVKFANGQSDVASFVVGCDGLHSNTRTELFGEGKADFTGLVQVAGIGPLQPGFADAMTNIYGEDVHLVTYQINDNEQSWAVTLRESEAKESWRAMDASKEAEFKASPYASWSYGGSELVQSTKGINKYGLYDRPELASWHKGRVVLLGDAAHPTSPHLGQGANQAFEDVYHLVRCLVKYNPDAGEPSTEDLSKVFEEYEKARIQRTSALVSGARQQGNARVVHGQEACLKRNEILRKIWGNAAAMKEAPGAAWAGPFTGAPEI